MLSLFHKARRRLSYVKSSVKFEASTTKSKEAIKDMFPITVIHSYIPVTYAEQIEDMNK